MRGHNMSMLDEMNILKISITIVFDEESGYWSVEESNVPGLATCAKSTDELMKNCADLLPDLLELNAHLFSPKQINAELFAEEETDQEIIKKIPIEYLTRGETLICA